MCNSWFGEATRNRVAPTRERPMGLSDGSRSSRGRSPQGRDSHHQARFGRQGCLWYRSGRISDSAPVKWALVEFTSSVVKKQRS